MVATETLDLASKQAVDVSAGVYGKFAGVDLVGGKRPIPFRAKLGDLAGRGWIVGEDADPHRTFRLAHGTGQTNHRPGAEQAAGIDKQVSSHGLNGLLRARACSRRGTAPKPNSRRIPFIK